MASVKKKKEKYKKKEFAKSKTRKGGLSQKWASWWTENLKGRSRQKLWAYKKQYFPDGLKTRKGGPGKS
jgi:hypothetical protein